MSRNFSATEVRDKLNIVHFQATAVGFVKPIPNLKLSDVWSIQVDELSEHARLVLSVLEADDPQSKAVYHRLVWSGQAILEFQDLQPIILPKNGPFLHANFLFFQCLEILRQAVLSGLNGQTHASLAILRSSLEHLLFHYWWRSRLLKEETFAIYYAWLRNEPNKPKDSTFSKVIKETFQQLDLPPGSTDENNLRRLYEQLCSYVHKPLLSQSVTTIRGGNIPGIGYPEIHYWLSLLDQTQRVLLDIAIGNSPQALFPIEIHRKFGFATPVGALFDHSNFIPLSEALGNSIVAAYRKHYEGRNPPADTLLWANSRDDLTDEQVLKSWPKQSQPNDANEPFDVKVFERSTYLKAETRAQLFVFSNGEMDHDFQMGQSEATITLRH